MPTLLLRHCCRCFSLRPSCRRFHGSNVSSGRTRLSQSSRTRQLVFPSFSVVLCAHFPDSRSRRSKVHTFSLRKTTRLSRTIPAPTLCSPDVNAESDRWRANARTIQRKSQLVTNAFLQTFRFRKRVRSKPAVHFTSKPDPCTLCLH